jgi:predicted metallopeptidase
MTKKRPRRITYELAGDIQERFEDIVRTLDLRHIDTGKVVCVRSFGSSARRVIARCHGMSKVLQVAMRVKAFYALEFISERFDRLSDDDQGSTIIHEIMHIPKNFGGGFRFHDHVTTKNVVEMLSRYRSAKRAQVEKAGSWP